VYTRRYVTVQLKIPGVSFVSLPCQMLLRRGEETCKLPDDVGERKLVRYTAADAIYACGGALCRYNDIADIDPPHLCSMLASSEAEALNARRRHNKHAESTPQPPTGCAQ
jgi:hypothetical protein